MTDARWHDTVVRRIDVAACAVTTLLVLALLAHYTVADQPPAVRLIVSPRVAMAPQDVVVLVRLVPQANDRGLTVTADSGEFYRSSEWTLDGTSSARLFRVEWLSVPAGEFVVTALVLGESGRVRAAASAPFVLR